MKKFICFFIAAALAMPLFAAPKPDAAAAELLKKFAEKGKKFQPASGTTAIFARGQLKYGLERTDYLHRWVDRPLFQDSNLQKFETGSFINDEAWKVMHHTVKELYKIDGFAFFPMTKGREDLYRVSAKPEYSLFVLPEMVSSRYKVKVNWENIFALVANALKSKQTYRINGKILFTTYPGDTDPAYWQEFKKRVTEKFGDKFLVVPMHQLPTKTVTGNGTLTVKDINTLADIIRKWLRCVDGYYYNYPPLNEYRRYDGDFDRNVMLPLLTGILAEDEFKGKLLVWGTKVGHENFYGKGTFTYNCGGTSMLRGTVGSAVAAKADIINLVEWDEQNENTSFRPTLYNSFSTQRIIRALSGIAKGKFFPRQEGDDPAVPNLILSYRKIAVAGETIEFETVNVPEAESSGKVLDIQLVIKNASGKIVKQFSGKLKDDQLAELRFNVKVADVLKEHILIPELVVNGRKFSSGFTPVELRANWNADNKWVKQPLRDLAKCETELKIVGTTPDGRIKLQGKVKSEIPLHSVDVVDSGDHIYQHNPDNAALESEQNVVFALILGGYGYKNLKFKGDIKVLNAPDAKCFTRRHAAMSGCVVRPDGWHFPAKRWIPGFFNTVLMQLVIPRKALENAEIDVDLQGVAGKFTTPIYKGKIKLADIVKQRVFAANGHLGSHFVIQHTDIQHTLPKPLAVKNAEFTLLVDPALPQSVYFIEVVDQNRKTFRSLPVTVFKPSGMMMEFSSFDFFDKHPISVKCDEAMLTRQKLEISPVHGTAVKNAGGKVISGMLGGNSSIINNYYFAESYGHGNLAIKYMTDKTPENVKNYPDVVKDSDGSFAWQFNGRSNVSLPQATIYPYCGFELRVSFTADDVEKRQMLITNSDQAFSLFIFKGRVYAGFYSMGRKGRPTATFAGPKIKAGVKTDCIVRFNQKTVQIECNGVKGKALPWAGYALYPAETSIGHALNRYGFTGKISKVEISPL